MEPVVYEESPFAEYLKEDGAGDSEPEWAAAADSPLRDHASETDTSPPASPSPFAPTGRPLVKTRFRKHIPSSLQIRTPGSSPLQNLRRSCSAAVAASIDRADNARFLEQFRYTIVASQLLSEQSLGQHPVKGSNSASPLVINANQERSIASVEGILASIFGALAVSFVLSWALGKGPPYVTKKRIVILVFLSGGSVFLGQIFLRRQWLRYRREQALSEITAFVSHSHDLDSVTGAALSLIQEVELVSRGFRLSTPLPPISRIEERTQTRRCLRIRKALKETTSEVLATYKQVLNVVRGFSEQINLEKYYDIYDINDFDIQDALAEMDETDIEEAESLRTLKILAARFHVTRKLFLCALLALEADGERPDLLRWTAAGEALRTSCKVTKEAHDKLHTLLSEEGSFPVPDTPKIPLTPNKEKWRSQLRKLNSLSTGIRGLQAKLQLLREESDTTLNNSDNLTELGPNLLLQYESIGSDLKELMSVWEEGKTALAIGIDRNEKRLSSMSTLISPTHSLSGLTTVDEGGDAEDALKALTGETPIGSDVSAEEVPEVFEAVAMPKPRSTLTREERITKMKEDREHKAQARQQVDATKGMLRELETVIKLRPKSRVPRTLNGRVVSM